MQVKFKYSKNYQTFNVTRQNVDILKSLQMLFNAKAKDGWLW